jgi:hypothetical protein
VTRDDLLHDRAAVAGLVRSIVDTATQLGRPATFMEVCGTHTHAVAGAGLRKMLPTGIRLVSGPGCPVCVTPVGYLDRALALLPGPAPSVHPATSWCAEHVTSSSGCRGRDRDRSAGRAGDRADGQQVFSRSASRDTPTIAAVLPSRPR